MVAGPAERCPSPEFAPFFAVLRCLDGASGDDPEGFVRSRSPHFVDRKSYTSLPIQIVYPTTRLLSAKVRCFIELTIATCKWSFVEL